MCANEYGGVGSGKGWSDGGVSNVRSRAGAGSRRETNWDHLNPCGLCSGYRIARLREVHCSNVSTFTVGLPLPCMPCDKMLEYIAHVSSFLAHSFQMSADCSILRHSPACHLGLAGYLRNHLPSLTPRMHFYCVFHNFYCLACCILKRPDLGCGPK